MDVADLIAVRAVASSCSFRRAAESLGVRQSTLSRRVRRLEDELGVSLFERRPSGARLTYAGRRFLKASTAALDLLEEACASAGLAGVGGSGQLRIGLHASIARGFVFKVMELFRSRHAEVAIEVTEGRPEEHARALREHRLDVAFLTGERPFGDLAVEHLWTERVALVLPVSHRLARGGRFDWAMLSTERFIVSRDEPGPEIRDWLTARLGALGRRPDIRAHAVGRETLMVLVALGLGLTVVGEAATGVRYPGVAVRLLEDSADWLPFSAVWSYENDNPALRRFLSIARTHRNGRQAPEVLSPASSSAAVDRAAPSQIHDPSP